MSAAPLRYRRRIAARIHRRFEKAVGGRHQTPSTPFKKANDVSSGTELVTTTALSGLTESRGIPKGARVRFKLLAGLEASRDGASLFFGPAGAGGCGGGFGPVVPLGAVVARCDTLGQSDV